MTDYSEPKIEAWREVEVTGNPGEPFPMYRFVFRSDNTEVWEQRHVIIRRALEDWEDGKVRTRAVIRHSWETDWKEGEDHQAAHDEAAWAVQRHYDERYEERAVWEQP